MSVDDGLQVLDVCKHPALLVHQEESLNAGTTLDLRPGHYQIMVRAWDSSGRTQPEEMGQVWNWKGYLNHAWHRVNVFVK